MKKKIVYFLIFIFIAIVQISIMPVIANENPIPDLVLMSILAWSVLDGFFIFLPWSIFFGITYDLLTYSLVGEHVLIFLAVLYFVSFFSRRISFEFKGIGLFLFLLFVVVVSGMSQVFFALMAAWHTQILSGFWNSFGSLSSIILQLLINMLLFFLCLIAIKNIKRFFALENK